MKANGAAVVRAVVREPRIGRWSADVVVDADALEGEVRLEGDGATWVGRVRRAGVVGGVLYARLEAAGDPDALVPARPYERAPVRLVASEIAAAAGLPLEACPGDTLARWSLLGGSAWDALGVLAAALGVPWRVSRAGGLRLGRDSWDALDLEVRALATYPATRRIEVSADAATLEPGRTWGAYRIASVVHRWDGGSYRATVSHE